MVDPELLKVVAERGEPLWPRAVQPARPLSLDGDQPRPLEDAQVLGDRRTRHVDEARSDLSGRQLPMVDEPEDLAAPGLGDGIQDGFHPGPSVATAFVSVNYNSRV